MIIVLCLILWYLSGLIPAVLIWRTKFDLTVSDISVIMTASLFGPFGAFAVYASVSPQDKIIIPKRRRP